MKALGWAGKGAAWVAIQLIRFYQLILSPAKYALFGPNAGCRYRPTCSSYAIECFRTLPLWKAAYYAAKRILSCHPWGGSGYDPVPKQPHQDRNYVKNGKSVASLKDEL